MTAWLPHLARRPSSRSVQPRRTDLVDPNSEMLISFNSFPGRLGIKGRCRGEKLESCFDRGCDGQLRLDLANLAGRTSEFNMASGKTLQDQASAVMRACSGASRDIGFTSCTLHRFRHIYGRPRADSLVPATVPLACQSYAHEVLCPVAEVHRQCQLLTSLAHLDPCLL